MSYEGMDSEVVRDLGAQLKVQGDRLEAILGTVDRMVGRARWAWPERDGAQFRAMWQARRPTLATVAAGVRNLGAVAVANAEAQQAASSASVGWSTGSQYGTYTPNAGPFPSSSGQSPLRLLDGLVSVDTFVDLVRGANALDFLNTSYGFMKGLTAGGKWGLTWQTAVGVGEDLKFAGRFMTVLSKVAPGLGFVEAAVELGSGDWVAGALAATGGVLGVAALVASAPAVVAGLVVAGVAVGAGSVLWGMLPQGTKDAVNHGISKAVGATGRAIADGSRWVVDRAVDVAKGVTRGVEHGVQQVQQGVAAVVDTGRAVVNETRKVVSKTVDTVVDAGKHLVQNIFRKPSWLGG